MSLLPELTERRKTTTYLNNSAMSYIEDNFNYGDNATVVTLNVGDNGTNYSFAYVENQKTLYQGKVYTYHCFF